MTLEDLSLLRHDRCEGPCTSPIGVLSPDRGICSETLILGAMASKGSKGRAKAKASVAASADDGGQASAAAKQDTAHKLYKQLKKRIAVAQLVPEADRLVSPQLR